jgi:hypothetical protein
MDRKKFFGIFAVSSALGLLTSFPDKFLKNITHASMKNVNVKIHPDAVKRNKV